VKHRHIDTQDWSKEAIDSALERGDLQDWQELFAEARIDRNLARDVVESAKRHSEMTGSSLAIALSEKLWDI